MGQPLNRAHSENTTQQLSPESGALFTAIPVPSLGTQLSSEELRVTIALRTGLKICENHQSKCGKNADEF